MHDIEDDQRQENIDRQKSLNRTHEMIRNRINMKIVTPQDRHITGDDNADHIIDDERCSPVK